jgi:DNA modification methylase
MTQSKSETDAELNDYDGSEWVKFTTKTWKVYRPDSRGEDDITHPAKFPEELAEDYIKFFTQSGELVFDPFAGVGTTVSMAEQLERQAIGVELNDEYVSIGDEKLATEYPSEMVKDDARRFIKRAVDDGIPFPDPMGECVPPSIDFVFTSPPYWDVLNKSRGGAETTHKQRERDGVDTTYSNDDSDLGNIPEYEKFIDTLAETFEMMYPLLDQDAYLAIVTQNVRDDDGEVKPISYDLASRLSETYTLKGERLWLQDDKQSAIWGYPTEYVSGKSHHIINVFKKEGDDDCN